MGSMGLLVGSIGACTIDLRSDAVGDLMDTLGCLIDSLGDLVGFMECLMALIKGPGRPRNLHKIRNFTGHKSAGTQRKSVETQRFSR